MREELRDEFLGLAALFYVVNDLRAPSLGAVTGSGDMFFSSRNRRMFHRLTQGS